MRSGRRRVKNLFTRQVPPAGAVTFAGDALTNRFLVAGCIYHILVIAQYKAPPRKAVIHIAGDLPVSPVHPGRHLAYFSRAVS